jgi:hypothetical protein
MKLGPTGLRELLGEGRRVGEGSKKEALMSSYLLAPHNRLYVICCCSCVGGGGGKWGWRLQTQIFVAIIPH